MRAKAKGYRGGFGKEHNRGFYPSRGQGSTKGNGNRGQRKVWEVYVAKRRDVRGHRYGFVRFLDVHDVAALENKAATTKSHPTMGSEDQDNLSDSTSPEEEDIINLGDQCEQDDPRKWDPKVQKMANTQGEGKVACDLTRLEEKSSKESVIRLFTMSKCQQGQEPEIRGAVDNMKLQEIDFQMPHQSRGMGSERENVGPEIVHNKGV
ncbi:hypothetical protein VNO78_07987 [Psophocarpus tetragonolobus]|uniref:Uncharacterized protein n=1 Tax=Psophocarpus tetragonolobus TaxID=3891 RepID=A0AAN9SU78_PSOTE